MTHDNYIRPKGLKETNGFRHGMTKKCQSKYNIINHNDCFVSCGLIMRCVN
jgi:hypothetical protein